MDAFVNNHNNGLSNSNSREKLFHRSESVPNVTKRIVEMLDHIEQRVELLREHASAMESEKDALVTMLSSIQSHKDLSLASDGEKEEIELTAQRLLSRTLTIEVSVTTPRNEIQQQALDKVNKYFDELLVNIQSDSASAKQTLQHYINACLSECQGPIHQKFQYAVLECTADDQKRTRKRLESLMNSLSINS